MINLLALLCLAVWCSVASSQPSSAVFLGTLTPLQHQISGELYAIDEKTFFIQDFNYDGFGLAVFVYVYLTGQTVSRTGGGTVINWSQTTTKVPQRRFSSEDVNISLTVSQSTAHLNISNIQTFTIWSELFLVFFTRLDLPTDVNIPPVVAEEPTVAPVVPSCVQLHSDFQVSWTHMDSHTETSNVMTDPTSTIGTTSAASTSFTSVGPNPTTSITTPTSTTPPTSPTKPPKIIISSSPSPRVTIGSHLSLYCIAVEGMPVPQVQWYSDGLPVYPSPQMYQQIYVVPTDSPHTTTYTCVGTTHSEGVITNELKVNITVTVEKSCPRLRAPRNGDVTITNDQQLAVFSCDRFYTMRGSHVLKCKKGKWNASPPTCHSISRFCRRKCDF